MNRRALYCLAGFAASAVWTMTAPRAWAQGVPPLTKSTGAVHVLLHSLPGDYIGDGKDSDLFFTPENSATFSVLLGDFVGPGQPGGVLLQMFPYDGPFLNIQFSTFMMLPPVPLQAGVTYTGATNSPSYDKRQPYFTINFDSRTANLLSGEFTIDRFDLVARAGHPDGVLLAYFEAHFQEHEASIDAPDAPAPPTLFGTVTYANPEALVQAAAPEPGTGALLLGLSPLLLGGVVFSRRDRPKKDQQAA
jgi:hypothetical protein